MQQTAARSISRVKECSSGAGVAPSDALEKENTIGRIAREGRMRFGNATEKGIMIGLRLVGSTKGNEREHGPYEKVTEGEEKVRSLLWMRIPIS
jgi:hypothetical protein